MTSPSRRGFVVSGPTPGPALPERGPGPEQTAHDQAPELRCVERHELSGPQAADPVDVVAGRGTARRHALSICRHGCHRAVSGREIHGVVSYPWRTMLP